ncbi:uncharacterized protein F5891DRAFT_950416, partial [Suillus fuscotomentosus]
GHCLFISTFMLASKVICDDTYSNKSWSSYLLIHTLHHIKFHASVTTLNLAY